MQKKYIIIKKYCFDVCFIDNSLYFEQVVAFESRVDSYTSPVALSVKIK
jgi:hypothetical protein